MSVPTITLPTLEQLRDFYAAMDPEQIAATCKNPNHCIIANVIAPQLPKGYKIAVSVSEPEQYEKYPGTVWLDMSDALTGTVLATLTPELNAMAHGFDETAIVRNRDRTAAECVEIIEEHIRLRYERQAAA